MNTSIPNLLFRIEPGYTFESDVRALQFHSNNILVGKPSIDFGSEAIFLGKIAEYGRSQNVWLDCQGAHAVYVMGKRRSGKTYTLGVIMEGLASNAWIRQGSLKQSILMLDTMNVFITMPYNVTEVHREKSSEVAELRKWHLDSERFNICLFYPRGTTRPAEGMCKEIAIRPADLDDKDWAALFGVDTYSDPIGQLIAELYQKVVVEGYEDTRGTRKTPESDYAIESLLICLDTCSEIQSAFHPDTIRAVRSRLRAVERLPVFSKTGLDMREIFVPGQISVLLLRDLEQEMRSLLIGVMVKKIMQLRSASDKFERLAVVQKGRYEHFSEKNDQIKAKEALELCQTYQTEAQKGLQRGWIIIDEAHNYMPAKNIMPSSEPLKKYVNEGRNLGLSIVMATQNPSALDPSIRRNADILIVHSMSMRDDISTAEGMINTFIPESFGFGTGNISSRVFEQLVRSLPLGYALVSNDAVSRVFVTKIRPRISVHGGIEY